MPGALAPLPGALWFDFITFSLEVSSIIKKEPPLNHNFVPFSLNFSLHFRFWFHSEGFTLTNFLKCPINMFS